MSWFTTITEELASMHAKTIGKHNVGKQDIYSFQVLLHWALINHKYTFTMEKSGEYNLNKMVKQYHQ